MSQIRQVAMDASEKLAEKYLLELGLGEVLYEPNGNIPPDFSVSGRVGVEVRRLNQSRLHSSGRYKGLEEEFIPLWQGINTLCSSMGPSVLGESWFVNLSVSRPIQKWKTLRVKIEGALREFMHAEKRVPAVIEITPNLEIDFLRASSDLGTFFALGASIDEDSGGWVVNEVEHNLRLCVAEKEQKIAPYRHHFAEWWLVLVDQIAYSMDSEEREIFRAEVMPKIHHGFAKIVLLNPLDYRSAAVF